MSDDIVIKSGQALADVQEKATTGAGQGVSASAGVAAMGGSIASLFIARASGDDPGAIKLNGIPMPGLVEAISVHQAHDEEGVPIEGKSGQVILWHGLPGAEISVGLHLLDDEKPSAMDAVNDALTGNFADAVAGQNAPAFSAYEKLQVLAQSFVRMSPEGPVVYLLDNDHVRARLGGITQAHYADLDSEEDNEQDGLRARLRFLELNPAANRVQGRSDLAEPSPDSLDSGVIPWA